MTNLTQIAGKMRVEAQQQGRTSRLLQRGLHLALLYDNGLWTLAISRKGKAPSDIERHTCAKAFAIPPAARWQRTEKRPWHRVWYRWAEPVALSQVSLPLPGNGSGQKGGYYQE